VLGEVMFPVACPPVGPDGEVAAAGRAMAVEHGARLQLGTVVEGNQRGGGVAGGRRNAHADHRHPKPRRPPAARD